MSRVPRLPRPFVVGGVVVTVALSAIGFLPLFGGPGYEHSVATGLIVPSAAAIATAHWVAKGRSRSPLASVGAGASAGLAFASLSLLTALLHAARVGICELWGAVVYFALTAGIGSLMGGAWGAASGELLRAYDARRGIRRIGTVAVLVALAAPVAGVVVSVYRFYSSPMIFAFDPFVGYFSGTLYDTVIEAGNSLLTYRLGSLATLIAVALFGSILVRAYDRPLGVVLDLTSAPTRTRAALGFVAMIASISFVLAGLQLGHHSTTASIEADLGGQKHGPRCDIVYPKSTRERDAELFLQDCEEEIAAVEARLDSKGPARIRAFFFRDENDKKRLMGAAHTYIAKPWREEVYLQVAAYPHPVLGHELAHVIAGSFGRGPFRIAGNYGGYLPNPGLIEGVAVAASPDDEDLTDAQWARAMMQIGILPSMKRVFSFGFLGDTSAKSYTLAGAFITWIAETRGMEIVRRWYQGGDVEELTHQTWQELDAGFRKHLEAVPLPAEAESFAKARFNRPGIFGRKCPHVVDAMRREADQCRDTQRFEEAIALYKQALSKDPTDHASRYGRALTVRRLSRTKGAIDDVDLAAIAASETEPRSWRDRAEEALADADFVDGRLDQARARYEGLAARSVDEDNARTLEVKELATVDPSVRRGVGALLLGDQTHPPDVFVAGVLLGSMQDRDRSPLANYLIGRNLVQRGFYEAGRDALEVALEAGLPTPRIARESLRQQAVAACALHDAATLTRVEARIEAPGDPFKGAAGGRREATLRMIARCSGKPLRTFR